MYHFTGRGKPMRQQQTFSMNPQLNSILLAYRAWARSCSELWKEPIKLILHPSVWRIRWLGIFIILGNPIFYYIWTRVFVQPYESLPSRLLMCLLGALILVETQQIVSGHFFWKWFCVFVLFLQLPMFFLYMAYLNDFNPIWLGSCVAMILIYYQAVDWRIASFSTTFSVFLVFILSLVHPINDGANENNVIFCIVFLFAWLSAIILGGSAANLSKINILNTAYNLGVMAHELRTPISSVGILSTVLKLKYHDSQDQELLELSKKLDLLVKNINYHIDNQISNSNLINIKINNEKNSIVDIIESVLKLFPYKNDAEKNIIKHSLADDFIFNGSATLYTQVFNNLIRNALKALAAKELQEQDKRIDIVSYVTQGTFGKQIGCIDITDNGVGIQAEHIRKVLEPFFSTNDSLGHGLGLSFCKKVVEASKGNLSIESIYGHSTTITIQLPLMPKL
jgi:two-component system, CAI-1 autoinducer sensor kinase/phosphatase CqsS